MGKNLEKKAKDEIMWRFLEISFGVFLFVTGEALRHKTDFNYTGGGVEILGGLYSLYNGKKLGEYLSRRFFRR